MGLTRKHEGGSKTGNSGKWPANGANERVQGGFWRRLKECGAPRLHCLIEAGGVPYPPQGADNRTAGRWRGSISQIARIIRSTTILFRRRDKARATTGSR